MSGVVLFPFPRKAGQLVSAVENCGAARAVIAKMVKVEVGILTIVDGKRARR